MFYERVGKKGDGLNQNKAYKRVYRYLFRKRNTLKINSVKLVYTGTTPASSGGLTVMHSMNF